MRLLALVCGIVLILLALSDMFESVVLPRTVTRRLRLARLFYRTAWVVSTRLARAIPGQRAWESVLGAFGPLSLPVLLALWALCLICGFAGVLWGVGAHVVTSGLSPGLMADLYLSGATFFTLGYGDVLPGDTLSRAIAVTEAGVGFGFLAIVIGYLPVIYQAFSRREVGISMLDSRAGSPPTAGELIRRHGAGQQMPALAAVLRDAERWAADLLESHLSYPVLAYYRSQHDRESWLAVLTALLDTCALLQLGGLDSEPWHAELLWQAKHTFAMARHVVIDLALVLRIPPLPAARERLSEEDRERLQAALVRAGLRLPGDADAKLAALRQQYEPYIQALGDRLFLAVPGWVSRGSVPDNWQTSAWDSRSHF